MTAVLLVLIIVIQKCFSFDEEMCYNELQKYSSAQKLHCDAYMISTVQDMLESVKKLNRYLQYKNQSYDGYKEEYCTKPNEKIYCTQQQVYSSCKIAVAAKGPGVYLIDHPYLNMNPFMIYCEADPEGGPAWTVIQRRICDDVNFHHEYKHYIIGFGGLYDSFWMGLERLHSLTTYHDFELWIEFTRLNGKIMHAKYDHFGIGSQDRNYNLLFLGNYTGDAGDGLRASVGYAFSTFDARNDDWKTTECGEPFGGWWYGKGSCERHLNADFTKIAWMQKYYGFLQVQMAIRERKGAGCS